MVKIRKGQSIDLSVGRGIVAAKFTGGFNDFGAAEFETPGGKRVYRTPAYLQSLGYSVPTPKPAKVDESE